MANPLYAAAAWADAAAIGQHWRDAPTTPGTLDRLISVATRQAKDYAPALADTDVIPDSYVLAVIYQARELHNAVLRGDTDIIGVGDFAIRVRPLTGVVRAMLRPEQGLPVVG